MPFEAGVSGNPRGRPKGSFGGRIKALASLDRLLSKKRCQEAMVKALEIELLKNPVSFFRNIVMPLLPKESRLEFDRVGAIAWRSLVAGADKPAQLPAADPPVASEMKNTEGE